MVVWCTRRLSACARRHATTLSLSLSLSLSLYLLYMPIYPVCMQARLLAALSEAHEGAKLTTGDPTRAIGVETQPHLCIGAHHARPMHTPQPHTTAVHMPCALCGRLEKPAEAQSSPSSEHTQGCSLGASGYRGQPHALQHILVELGARDTEDVSQPVLPVGKGDPAGAVRNLLEEAVPRRRLQAVRPRAAWRAPPVDLSSKSYVEQKYTTVMRGAGYSAHVRWQVAGT